jgi:CheY-like chemotaxis protein
MDKKRILAVDDEQDNLEFIKSILEDETKEVITANDGEEGLQKAKEENPDLIILDVQMPKKDGFATFKEIKQDPKLTDIPIIMLTGIGEKLGLRFTEEEMGIFYGAKPEYYAEKPIDPEKLENIVKKILS